jgi:nitrogen regulatory protein P-II 1
MVIKDSAVDLVCDTIIGVSRTDEIGDGKIFIGPIKNIIRVRKEERGEDAIW